MQVIAKTTDGVLISATKNEVKEILNSVTGERPKELNIGQKIPAIDYASTITKVKALADHEYYKNMLQKLEWFTSHVNKLTEAVEATKNIQL